VKREKEQGSGDFYGLGEGRPARSVYLGEGDGLGVGSQVMIFNLPNLELCPRGSRAKPEDYYRLVT
jgi:hypothetical protein